MSDNDNILPLAVLKDRDIKRRIIPIHRIYHPKASDAPECTQPIRRRDKKHAKRVPFLTPLPDLEARNPHPRLGMLRPIWAECVSADQALEECRFITWMLLGGCAVCHE